MVTADFSGLDILILEDDLMLRKRLAAQFERLGADVTGAETLQAARQFLGAMTFDFALIDVNLPDGLGTDLLREKAFPAHTGVIVVTAHGAVNGAVEAVRLGALDYLVKPFEAEEVLLVIDRARRARQSARIKEQRQKDDERQGLFFGEALAPLSAQLERILGADQRVQSTPPPILIQGETGTGKTSIARWVHQHGPRANRELVEVNCSALPEPLAESELFGHERGAFTDARNARMGLFEAANGGTLFLDELPSLPPTLQAKVLLAIEDRKIRRVGSNKSIAIDVRVIAASNRELLELVSQGKFREDLYHRLDLFRISIPPLRERGEDIVRLANQLIRQLCEKHRMPSRTISEVGRQRIKSYPWPGNVRELAHEIERAIVFEDAEALDFPLLNTSIRFTDTSAGGDCDWLRPGFRFPPSGFSLDEAIDRLMQIALEQAQHNVSAAARLLGVPRDFVRYRLGQKTRKLDGN